MGFRWRKRNFKSYKILIEEWEGIKKVVDKLFWDVSWSKGSIGRNLLVVRLLIVLVFNIWIILIFRMFLLFKLFLYGIIFF